MIATGTSQAEMRLLRLNACGMTSQRHRIDHDELLERIKMSINDFTSTFAGMQAVSEPGQHIMPSDLVGNDLSVTAMIGFEGSYQGIAWISCSKPLVMRLATGLYGNEPDMLDENMHATLGELLNVLGGDVKLYLSPRGQDLRLSLPSLFHGKIRLHNNFIAEADVLRCSFMMEDERLLAGVTLRKVAVSGACVRFSHHPGHAG